MALTITDIGQKGALELPIGMAPQRSNGSEGSIRKERYRSIRITLDQADNLRYQGCPWFDFPFLFRMSAYPLDYSSSATDNSGDETNGTSVIPETFPWEGERKKLLRAVTQDMPMSIVSFENTIAKDLHW